MSDSTNTESTEVEDDILLLCYENGETDTVTLPPGTLNKLEGIAKADGKEFNEDFLRDVIIHGLEMLENKPGELGNPTLESE